MVKNSNMQKCVPPDYVDSFCCIVSKKGPQSTLYGMKS